MSNPLSFIEFKLPKKIILNAINRNLSWLFLDKVIRLCVGFFVSILLARYLGPDNFGFFNFTLAYVGLFSSLSALGLDGIIIRNFVNSPKLRDIYISTAFILKFIAGFFAYFASILIIFYLQPGNNQTHIFIYLIGATLIFQSFDILEFWFQSEVKSKYIVYSKTVSFLIFSIIKIYLIYLNSPIIAFAWTALLESITGSIGLFLFYLRKASVKDFLNPKIKMASLLLKESWPAILSSIAIMVYMRIDQLMLSSLSSNKELGLYSVALRFSELWYFIPTIIVNSVMPTFTRLKKLSYKLFMSILRKLFLKLTIISYTLAIIITFFSDKIISITYGEAFLGAGSILSIHIWSAVFVFIGIGMSPWLINMGMLKYSLIQTSIGAMINIILNMLLIPKYGGIGAAIATLVAYAFAGFLLNICFKETRIIFRMQLKSLCLSSN